MRLIFGLGFPIKTMTNQTKHFVAGAALVLAGVLNLSAAETMPTPEEMWRMIQQQQKQIEELTKRLDDTNARTTQVAEQTKSVEQKVEATSSYVETLVADGGASGDAWYKKTSIGGYGELHFNTGATDRIDFHRFVLFVNHEFSDKIRLFSELEVEHAFSGAGAPGEVELEQAFIEFDLNEHTTAKAGLFLLPIGIINETHEPNTFYGVERNQVESAIIPSTWWEAGAALTHTYESGFSVDFALHSGLNTTTANIRSGRQKVANADAQDGAATMRLKYTGVPGLTLAGSVQYQQDIAQGTLPGETADAILTEIHADWRKGGFGLRALYARWDLNGPTAAALGRDEQYGYYIEPSYRFAIADGTQELGFFARYSFVDNVAGDNVDSGNRFTEFGVNYWPHPQVVLKADMQFADRPAGDDETVSLGVGFQF